MRSLSALWSGRVAVLMAWERGTKAEADAVCGDGKGASVVAGEEATRGSGGSGFVVASMTEVHALVGRGAGEGRARIMPMATAAVECDIGCSYRSCAPGREVEGPRWRSWRT